MFDGFRFIFKIKKEQKKQGKSWLLQSVAQQMFSIPTIGFGGVYFSMIGRFFEENLAVSNAGIYLIKKSVLQQLEYGKHCDATDLMQRLIDKGDKVTSFPIVGYWIDIGRHEDYKKAQEFIKYVKR